MPLFPAGRGRRERPQTRRGPARILAGGSGLSKLGLRVKVGYRDDVWIYRVFGDWGLGFLKPVGSHWGPSSQDYSNLGVRTTSIVGRCWKYADWERGTPG